MSQIKEYLKMAVSNIRANKVRSFLTMLGIIIGISSVILIIALGNGAKNIITDEMSGLGAGQVSVYTYDDTGTYFITNDDIDAIKKQVSGIRAVNTTQQVNGTTQTRKGEFQVTGTGEMADAQLFSNDVMLRGSFFNSQQYLSGEAAGVISDSDAIRLFGSTDVVGKTMEITFGGRESLFRVVGVTKTKTDSLLNFTYENSPISISFPLTTLSKINGSEMDNYSSVMLLTEDKVDSKKLTSQVVSILNKRHMVKSDKDIFQVQSFNDYMSIVDTVINAVTMLISMVAAISLVVGGIGVMNIMLVSVTERTREIGIRKALGAKTKSILLQFLMESAIITMIGGLIGIALGIGLAYGVAAIIGIVNPSLHFRPSINFMMIGLTTLFSSAIGLFFGIYPAKKAAKLSPIEALRRN